MTSRIYIKEHCPFCQEALTLLAEHGIQPEIVVMNDPIIVKGIMSVAGSLAPPTPVLVTHKPYLKISIGLDQIKKQFNIREDK